MDVKEERTQVTKDILRCGCENYLYEYLILRKEQASFTKNIQLEHDGYLANLHNFKNDSELGENAKIALNAFEVKYCFFLGVVTSWGYSSKCIFWLFL